MWKEIGRYRSCTPDGATEEFVLEKDDNGNFRIRNDFGNSVFEFERMSGYEFFRKVKRDIENDIEKELNDLWDDVDIDSDDCDDIDLSSFVPGQSIDSGTIA
tara:strand:+ start:596 stop:901 length:306 start_codon:yes stop_codon:yes gene_type:complete